MKIGSSYNPNPVVDQIQREQDLNTKKEILTNNLGLYAGDENSTEVLAKDFSGVAVSNGAEPKDVNYDTMVESVAFSIKFLSRILFFQQVFSNQLEDGSIPINVDQLLYYRGVQDQPGFFIAGHVNETWKSNGQQLTNVQIDETSKYKAITREAIEEYLKTNKLEEYLAELDHEAPSEETEAQRAIINTFLAGFTDPSAINKLVSPTLQGLDVQKKDDQKITAERFTSAEEYINEVQKFHEGTVDIIGPSLRFHPAKIKESDEGKEVSVKVNYKLENVVNVNGENYLRTVEGIQKWTYSNQLLTVLKMYSHVVTEEKIQEAQKEAQNKPLIGRCTLL